VRKKIGWKLEALRFVAFGCATLLLVRIFLDVYKVVRDVCGDVEAISTESFTYVPPIPPENPTVISSF
jgi:hypothetical protein